MCLKYFYMSLMEKNMTELIAVSIFSLQIITNLLLGR